MNRASPGFAAQFQAAHSSDSWNLSLEKFPFDLAQPDVPSVTGQPDHRGRARNLRPERLRAVRDRYLANRTELLVALAARRAFLDRLEKLRGSRLRRVTLVNAGRLALQVGRPRAREPLGLSCERITGLPMVPGMALQSLLRFWVQRMIAGSSSAPGEPAGDRDALASLAARIPGNAGAVPGGSTPVSDPLVFLGAWPKTVPDPGLEAAPSRPDSEGRPRDAAPSSLVIEPGHEWDFCLLAPVSLSAEEASSLLDTAERWLLQALEQSGLGGRSARDQGRFLTPVRWAALSAASPTPAVTSPASSRPSTPAAPPAASDYANELIFSNRVLKKLNPGAASQLELEIDKLRKRENAAWRARLIEALSGKDMREVRKKLKEKTWFPQEWLPP